MNDILLNEEKEDSRRYRFSLWWVEHRLQLKRNGIILFVVCDVLILLFVFWNLIDAYVLKYDAEQLAVTSLTQENQDALHAYTLARAAEPLTFTDASVFLSADSHYDLYAELTNPNADWWAEFQYTFTFAGGETVVRNGFILPNEQKPIMELAYPSKISIDTAQVVLQNVTWHRVDHHQVPDYKKWSTDRLSLEILNPLFTQDTTIATHTLSRTTFTVKNNSPFSFYQPVFSLLLMQGSRVVAVNRTSLASLDANSQQDVVVNWFGVVPSNAQVEVIPEINIFDSAVYKPLTGTSSIDARTQTTP